ncbi:MAG TPA: hypothetical protein VFF30_14065 [Nitrososphaerales archaeon]|nr:hypothetical protein [Nitrososphaerales archaeon]
MVSDSDMGTVAGEEEEQSGAGEEGEMPESTYGAAEEESKEEAGEEAAAPAEEQAAKPKPTRGGGRRAALKIIRQNVESLSKDLSGFRKAHEANSKRLEKQVASLRNDVNALKSYIAKESAKARSKQEASLARIFSKLSAAKKPAAPARKAAAAAKKKSSSKSKSKGKK